MISLPPRRHQYGYMLEIPMLLVVVALGVAFLLPHLSSVGRKILVGIAALPVLFCLYYMIVIPGWQPDTSGRLKPPWNLLVFLQLAAMIVFGVVIFVVN